jgi:hypothetical protein
MLDPAASLQLFPPVRIWVRLVNDKYITYPVFHSETISSLHTALGIPERSLLSEGSRIRPVTFLFADRTLRPDDIFSVSGIVEDSVIELIRAGSWVMVVTECGYLRFGNRNHETVDAFIRRIEDTEGISLSGLVFEGQPLPGKRTFKACVVPTGAILTVPSIARIKITINTVAGRKHRLSVRPTDTTLDVKELVRNAEGIPMDEQRLIYARRQSEDTDSLEMHGIG